MFIFRLLVGFSILAIGIQSGNDGELVEQYFFVRTTISARFAITDLMSEVHNNRNQSDRVEFRATIPETAFISNFTMDINGKISVGSVVPLRDAYDVFINATEDAFLVSRYFKSFTVSMKIPAGAVAKFNLTYQEMLERQNGLYRYIVDVKPQKSVKTTVIDVVISEMGRINSVRVPEFQRNLTKLSFTELQEIPIARDAEVSRVRFDDFGGSSVSVGAVIANDDSDGEGTQLAIIYDVERDNSGGEILVVNGYFVHFFAPLDLPPPTRQIVFVLDKSGSMKKGHKFEQIVVSAKMVYFKCQKGMETILTPMRPRDHFNVILFSDDVERWRPKMVVASEQNKRLALDFLQNTKPDGITNIYEALKQGYATLADSGSDPFSSMILFLTDGVATSGLQDDGMIVREITRLNDKQHFAIHGLAFGNDADFMLLKKLCSVNRGLARLIYEDLDTPMQLASFVEQVKHPLLRGIRISYVNDSVDADSLVTFGLVNSREYHGGGELVTIGKTTSRRRVSASIVGKSADERMRRFDADEYAQRKPRPLLGGRTVGGFVERMWAYQTIRFLLDKREMVEKAERDKLAQRAVHLSMQYNLVSSLTGMIAIPPMEDGDSTCWCKPRAMADQRMKKEAIKIAPTRNPGDPIVYTCVPVSTNISSGNAETSFTRKKKLAMRQAKDKCRGADTFGCRLVVLVEIGGRSTAARVAIRRLLRDHGVPDGGVVIAGIDTNNRLTVTHRHDHQHSTKTITRAFVRATKTGGGTPRRRTQSNNATATLLTELRISDGSTLLNVIVFAANRRSVNRRPLKSLATALRKHADLFVVVSLLPNGADNALVRLMRTAGADQVVTMRRGLSEIVDTIACDG